VLLTIYAKKPAIIRAGFFIFLITRCRPAFSTQRIGSSEWQCSCSSSHKSKNAIIIPIHQGVIIVFSMKISFE
jgi:hypothetical protein